MGRCLLSLIPQYADIPTMSRLITEKATDNYDLPHKAAWDGVLTSQRCECGRLGNDALHLPQFKEQAALGAPGLPVEKGTQ